VAADVSGEIARIYAVAAVDQFERAYLFDVGVTVAPSFEYCSGRNIIIVGKLATLVCRQNACEDCTSD